MKKLTLSIGLVAAILSAKAQDTTCTYFKGKEVYEFDYQMDTILWWEEQTTKFYDIEVKYGNTLCLDLSDDKNRVRKVITTFFDGTKRQDTTTGSSSKRSSSRGVRSCITVRNRKTINNYGTVD